MFGYGVNPQTEVPLAASCTVVAPPRSSFLFAQISEGVKPEIALYIVEREQLAGAKTPWRKLFGDDAGVTDFVAYRDTLYLMKGSKRK